MKRFIFLLIILLVCVLLALWSPWLYIRLDIAGLFGVNTPESISSLQVYSLSGEVEVYLDGEVKGTTTVEKSPFVIDRVTPGEHLITIKRVSSVANAYWTFSQLVMFEAGTVVVSSYNLGPEEEFSEGHIIYAVKKESENDGQPELNIELNTPDAQIQIDNSAIQQINSNSFFTKIDTNSQKVITISKSGYESLKFTVLPDNQEDRDRLKNFDLNIEVHLMLQPVSVE